MNARRVLFLCTGNSARSILGEYLLRALSEGRIETASAGAAPTGRVHASALEVLREDYGIDASGARSQSIEDLRSFEPDLVITVCDHARQACPVWPGAPEQLHWGLEDPAAASGSPEEILAAFRATADELERRLRELLAG